MPPFEASLAPWLGWVLDHSAYLVAGLVIAVLAVATTHVLGRPSTLNTPRKRPTEQPSHEEEMLRALSAEQRLLDQEVHRYKRERDAILDRILAARQDGDDRRERLLEREHLQVDRLLHRAYGTLQSLQERYHVLRGLITAMRHERMQVEFAEKEARLEREAATDPAKRSALEVEVAERQRRLNERVAEGYTPARDPAVTDDEAKANRETIEAALRRREAIRYEVIP